MEKLITTIFILFTSIQFGFSQTILGIKAGANVSNITLDKEYQQVFNTKNENRIGYQIGLIAERQISSNLFLRPEFYYSIKGYKYYNQAEDKDVTVSFNYINLPVFIGYKLNPRLSPFLGPQIGILGPVYAKSNKRRSGNLNHIVNYNNFDLGVGAGVIYTVTPKISVDFRFSYGFNTISDKDITNGSGTYISSYEEKNNKSLEVSLNYFFRPKP